MRPVLEYGNSVWCPYLRKNIDSIEKIQRNFTKCIIGMKDLEYGDRLRALKLPSLEFRRVRGDMIEVFKILNNFYDPLTTHSLLTLDNSTTRGHVFKLEKFAFKSTKYQYFFTNRIINLWNNLPDHVVNAKSINNFKNKLDGHLTKIIYTTKIDIINLA